MSPSFHSKFKALSQQFYALEANSTPTQMLPIVNLLIEHIEAEITPYSAVLEKLKEAREELLPTVEDIQAIYRQDSPKD